MRWASVGGVLVGVASCGHADDWCGPDLDKTCRVVDGQCVDDAATRVIRPLTDPVINTLVEAHVDGTCVPTVILRCAAPGGEVLVHWYRDDATPTAVVYDDTARQWRGELLETLDPVGFGDICGSTLLLGPADTLACIDAAADLAGTLPSSCTPTSDVCRPGDCVILDLGQEEGT
ncbi:MAG: hypothetical protein H6733_15280 [Alphaproteobacteria bacterium]|nr:hypothetical protein [Alphaproteobacteria bacterium]